MSDQTAARKGATMRAITKEEALEFAAQVWCRPETETRVMDETFAQSIADAVYERQFQVGDGMRVTAESLARQLNIMEAERDAARKEMEEHRREHTCNPR